MSDNPFIGRKSRFASSKNVVQGDGSLLPKQGTVPLLSFAFPVSLHMVQSEKHVNVKEENKL